MIENRPPDFSGGRFSFYFAFMENLHEKQSLCALNRIFGFEPKIAHALIAHIGSASEIFNLSSREIDALLGPFSKFRGQLNPQALEDAARETEELSNRGIYFVGCTEDEYPDLLRECEDAPIGLYVRTCTPLSELFAPRRRIAIVGTRDISPYGHEWCQRIVQNIGTSPERPTIVSGLALGTDICAHMQALECGLPTIAVMATGPDSIYPSRHREASERIVGTRGCALITDYPPGTAPLAIHFLRRNRIIAGLCEATILIESRLKGGGMMTSRLAYSYNREVYALPGRVDDPRSQGCNFLIKSKIAEAIDSAEGLTASMGLRTARKGSRINPEDILRKALPNTDQETISKAGVILDIIRKNRGISIEDIAIRSGSDYVTTARLTGLMEMEDLISVDLLQRCTINIGKYR